MGYLKYQLEELQVSYGNGEWESTGLKSINDNVVGRFLTSGDCEGDCECDKLEATYIGGSTYTLPYDCNTEHSILKFERDIKSVDDTYPVSAMTSMVVGDCVTSLYMTYDPVVAQRQGWELSSLSSVVLPNNITYIGDYFFHDSKLNTFTSPSNLKYIGVGTFNDCRELTDITLNEGLKIIANGAFDGCTSLTSATIPSSVLSLGVKTPYVNSNGAFYGCTNLAEINFLSPNPPDMGSTNGAFPNTNNCPIYVPVGAADAYRSALGILFSYRVTDKVEPYLAKFTYTNGVVRQYPCMNGEVVDDDYSVLRCNENASQIEFGACTTKINAHLDGFNNLNAIIFYSETPPVVHRYGTFDGTNNCPIYVPCGSAQAYKTASKWSSYASRIQEMPHCIEPTGSTQYNYVQSGETCIGHDLYEVSIKQESTDGGVTWMNVVPNVYSTTLIEENSENCGYKPIPPDTGKYFATYRNGTVVSANCDYSSAITLNEISKYDLVDLIVGNCVRNIDGDVMRDCTSLSAITFGTGLTSIGLRAFSGCTGLTSLTFPNNLKSISAHSFDGCSGLTNITFGTGLLSIDYCAFQNCRALTSISLPNGLEYLGGFTNCMSLSSITIPDSVTSIGADAFYDCRSLTSLTIPSGVTFIEHGAFAKCSGLTSITCLSTVPPTLESSVFDYTDNCPIYVPCESVETYKNAVYWNSYASRILGIPPCGEPPTPSFDGKWLATYSDSHTESAQCDSSSAITSGEIRKNNLIAVEVGNCVTSIGTDAFYQCYNLTSVTIPDSVTSIGYGAFDVCYSLTSITIPSGVTSIGSRAFTTCTGLTSVTISSGITTLGDLAFYNCSSLTSITVLAPTPPTLGSNVFDNTNNCTIYVPSGSVNSYKSAWTSLSSRIQPIPNS